MKIFYRLGCRFFRLPAALFVAVALFLFSSPICVAADPHALATTRRIYNGKYIATCENSGQFCQAKGCGIDQITATELCESLCRGAVTTDVSPRRCVVGSYRLNTIYVPLPDVIPDLDP